MAETQEQSAHPPFIVGEVTKSWVDGRAASADARLLSGKFELVLNTNARRGYRLHSWKLASESSVLDGVTRLTESIVAVFELVEVRA